MINTRYQIIKKLGEGRSSVYLCNDIEFPNEKFAIKILPSVADKNEKENFLKEYFTLQKLEHPNVIKAYELGTVLKTDGEEGIDTGSAFIILEYFDGKELLSSDQIQIEPILKEIVKQICAALYYLHQSKYIYYDLKPENILVSFKDKLPQIRLIDLGLAEYSPSDSDYEIKGTAYYIAPELLKKDRHTHSVDFYSLGMVMYQMVYGRFPFNAKVELDIYKSAIENEFEFLPSQHFSKGIINVVKKLLDKDINQRYSSALQIIKDLNFQLDIDITKEFLPAKIYSCRDAVVDQLSSYLNDKDRTEVFSIKGFEGVGKSLLLNKMQELHGQAILISDIKGKSVEDLIRYLLRQILFSESVYQNLSEKDKQYLLHLLELSPKEIITEFRNSIAIISSNSRFILLIDDFNLYDQLVSNLLLEVIPILQVNNIKVIVSESSEHEFLSAKINNLKELTLGAFIDNELETFLEESYYSDFPREVIKDLILKNADLIPGNIKSFIKDLILFGIMNFSEKGVMFSDEEDKLSSISEAHFAVYDLRLANLSKRELIAAQIISTFEVYIDSNTLSTVIGLHKSEIDKFILNLQFNNIIQKFTSGQTLIFTSEAIKNYIYSSIENKKKLHHEIALNLTKKLPSFNRLESARQYELASEFETSYKITMEEIKEAERHSTYTYIQKILSNLIKLPLKKELINTAKIKMSEVYLKLGDAQSSLKIIRELKNENTQTKFDNKFYTIEGSALISSGEYEAGRHVISELLKKIKDIDEKNRLKVELAYVDFELKKYSEVIEYCDSLLNDEKLSSELKGRCYNLKGMINIYNGNDLNSALDNFQIAKNEFSKAGQLVRVSGVEVNIGNIFSILSDFENAELHWQKASEINQSIGNLEQQGLLLQNLGIFYFNRQKFDFAIQSYQNAIKIFLSIGNDLNRGLVLWDLGEIYIAYCEYESALSSLNEAQKLFEYLNNQTELLDVLFMKGKLFFKIGTIQELEKVMENFQIVYSRNNQQKSHKYFQELLIQLKFFYEKKSISVDEIKLIRKEMLLRGDNHNFMEVIYLLIQHYINNKLYQNAIDELSKPDLMDLCSQNSILEAEREYFLGIISKNLKSEKLLPPLVYFEKAYDLIKNQHINELTWKVLFEISDLYIERGNLHKAKYFVTYARELIYFIAEKIESPQLRAAYLRNSERFNTLKKLESYYPSN